MNMIITEITYDDADGVSYVPYTNDPKIMFSYLEDGVWVFSPPHIEQIGYAFKHEGNLLYIRRTPPYLKKHGEMMLVVK